MSAVSDFRNVFGTSLLEIFKRIPKAISVLRAALKSENKASTSLPIRLQFEVTDKCNYGCIMCDRENLKKRRKLVNSVPFEIFQRLANQINPLYLTLNGLGEPLMNPEIFNILDWSNNKKLAVSLPTNLGYINDDLFQKLVDNCPKILTVSMHGSNKEIYEEITQSKSFEKFIFYFEKLLKQSIKKNIRILCALQTKNLTDYEGFYAFLSKWRMVDRFCLVPVFDFQTGRSDKYRVVPTEEEKNKALSGLDALMNQIRDKKKKRFLSYWRNAVLQIRQSDKIHENGPCLVPWISTYVTGKGDVLPCCYLTSEIHKMGNIYQTSFSEIWNGKEYQNFRENLRNDRGNLEGCKNCPRNDLDTIKRYQALIGGIKKSGWQEH